MRVLLLHQVQHVKGNDEDFPKRQEHGREDAGDERGIHARVVRTVPVKELTTVESRIRLAHLTHARHRRGEHTGREEHDEQDERPHRQRSASILG